MISKDKLDEYFSIGEVIAKESESLLAEINSIEPIPGYKYLQFESIDDGCIEYFGEEYWQYGGYEAHKHGLPINLLYDSEAKKSYITGLEEKAKQKRMQDAEAKLRQEKLKEAQEKAQYERLKKQFERN